MSGWDISVHAAYAGGLATRVAELRRRFPDALLTCDLHDERPGPELICWDGHPQEIWVWIFEPDDPAGARRAQNRLEQLLANPYELARIVNKPVVAGPNSIFEQDCVTASSYFDVDGRIEVRSGPDDGIQLYRAFGIDGEDDFEERLAINLALGAAHEADRDSRKALGFQDESEDAADQPSSPRTNSDGRPWKRPESVDLLLTIDLPDGDNEKGRVVQEWFESARNFFAEILPSDALAGAARGGTCGIEAVIGAADGDEQRSWQLPFFNDEEWRSFVGQVDWRTHDFQYLRVGAADGQGTPGVAVLDEGSLEVEFWQYPMDGRRRAVLGITLPRAVFVRFSERAHALLRRAAEHGALFGMVGISYGVRLKTGLEYALYLHSSETVRSVEHTLPGYSWITIISESMARRLGGAERLRKTGAFVRVDHLAGGGWWLQAAETFDDYTDVAAEQVYSALRPALPEGTYPSTFKDEWRD
ncbi:hypothetical protein AB0B85_27710 [Micromonospora sp. NPDC049044]|uniref:hypothetical protein n=1 Tax=Micromonospora sp. NPDC049044 TaxID=3154827 RepID=UPI0033C758B3